MAQTASTFTGSTIVSAIPGLPGGHRLYSIVDSFSASTLTKNIYPPVETVVATWASLMPPQTTSALSTDIVVCNNSLNASGFVSLTADGSGGNYIQFARTGTNNQDASFFFLVK
jgi:hypothetical protein